ncbi:hypothetical protein EDD85DRAFT_1003614 [Armillaria nabsnona]|nr:hypothetical protein EDD85DRAFT_1003614 [Armillaria nabsnona]
MGNPRAPFPSIPIIDPILDQFWVDTRHFLEQPGFRLPPKFNPGWEPTNAVEERQAISRLTSVEIRSLVFEISVLFSSPPLSLDSRNHNIPILEVLRYDNHAILALPILRLFWVPPFDTVGEVVECFRQVFEVLQSDRTLMNIMMDPTKMYTKGFLAERPFMKIDCSGLVSPSCTHAACWPRYYLIDFGHARRYDPADSIPNEWILRGADKTAPKHCNPEAPMECNPFPTDIFYLGNMFREHILDTKEHCNPTRIGLDFLRPLVEDIVKENPSGRPTIDDVVIRFHALRKSLSRWRLQAVTQLGDQPLSFSPILLGA